MSKEFKILGDWDSKGVPLYLTKDEYIDPDYLERIKNSLPEKGNVALHSPQYLENKSTRNILIRSTDPEFPGCDVYVTFIAEGAGYLNVFGYYWYELVKDFDTPTILDGDSYREMTYKERNLLNEDGSSYLHKTIIFPNASLKGSGGGLIMGNTVKILYDPSNPDKKFPNNVGIGFFLIPNGWNSYTKTFNISSELVYSDRIFNTPTVSEPNGSLQTILLTDVENSNIDSGTVILGFEDIMRPNGDSDFNDLIVKISFTPNATDSNGSLTLSPNDPINKNAHVCDSTGFYINFTNDTMKLLSSTSTSFFKIKHYIKKKNNYKISLLKKVFETLLFEYDANIEFDYSANLDEEKNPLAFIITLIINKFSLNKFLYIIKSSKNNTTPSVLDENIRNIVYFQNDYVFESDIDYEYLTIYDEFDKSLLELPGRPDTSRMRRPLAMGDPHFTTITGKKYTITDLVGDFILFKNDYLTVNTHIDYYPPNNNHPIYKKLTFMQYIFIKYNTSGSHIIIDLFEKNKYYHIENDKIVDVSVENTPFKFVKNDENNKILRLETLEMGTIDFIFNYYLTQGDYINEFYLESNGLYSFKSNGLLVSAYNYSKLNNIYDSN